MHESPQKIKDRTEQAVLWWHELHHTNRSTSRLAFKKRTIRSSLIFVYLARASNASQHTCAHRGVDHVAVVRDFVDEFVDAPAERHVTRHVHLTKIEKEKKVSAQSKRVRACKTR